MYQQKIRTFAGKMWRFIPGYERSDLENDLLEVLWLCTLKYDPDNGANFNTFFWRSAKNRAISIERHAKAQKRFAEWVMLDPEEFALAVDRIISDFAAEDYALANLSFTRHG